MTAKRASMAAGRPRHAGRAAGRGRRVVLLAAALVLCAAGCGAAEEGGRQVTVFAASSLSSAFPAIGEQFEAANPGTRVVFNYAGSQDLVAQLGAGADADVIATADAASMAVVEAMRDTSPMVLASNRMAVAVPPGNPAGITGVTDLARPGLRLVLCAPAVPCGAAAVTLQQRLDVQWRPVSEESSVAGVLGKVRSGEADAGVVYATDVGAAGIPIPAEVNVSTRYLIAPVTQAGEPFVAFAAGEQGRAVLTELGFGPP